ncbi:MAG: peptidyl-prolyl cis-trans isomerase [Actinomycetota bacterium]|nr:peptidyl-prolyl cis-trans isomerase [Actinomycetota bacterium]
MSAIPKTKRLPLIVLGAVVIIFFAGFAIAEGLGNPSVPSDDVAVVQDAPAGLSPISQADFDRALQQTAASQSIKTIPAAGSAQYEQLKQGAMNNLLDAVWIQGEAADLGQTATPTEIASLLKQTISQNFKTQAEFDKFRKQAHFTQADIRTRIRLQILSNKIQAKVLKGVPKATTSQIEDYYNEAKSQFEQPASRDVRLVLNKDQAKVEQAKAALEKDSSDASWKKVAAQFSTDPSSKSNGGLRPSLTEGLVEQPLDKEIFSAQQGQISALVKTPLGYYVFEVEKITPSRTVPLNRATRAQIGNQLNQQAQQNAFSNFVNDFGSKWRARTFCASDYLIDRCDNFPGTAHPATAPPDCYSAHPPKGKRPDACPAPVGQIAPALPGTVSIVTPQGNRLPQRPVTPAVPTPTAGGALGGGLPGAVPSGGAPPTTAAP